ncbi:NAD-dependent deacetylase [Solihabitans fulvus]|uniref:protein acetyllysine N-acetyltransferase n=1 Tax=Solihabitans fulvus TaxID=1892852 RepID=A0A5B2WPY8_9PSEU|nr:Sir2 family NAD-dependent protein deacetylase [Solihabitans fulvus]KAA2253008.1 NAD-dependent deacetylase [Solihabitans fulvus]
MFAGARRITALTGAGVSTASGIPDYRGPAGVWTKDPAAQRMSTLESYLGDLEVRRAAWRRRAAHPVWLAEPNPAHRAFADLERSGRLRALVTQNVDGLHQKAGSTPSMVVELHGSATGTVCVDCGSPGSMRAALERVQAGEDEPDCPACGGILRSTAVLFGEPLDPEVLRRARAAVVDCDLLVAAGTSLTVQPAAGLVGLASTAGAAVLICNAEPTPYDGLATAVVRRPLAEALPELVAIAPIDDAERAAPLTTWGDPSTWS